MAQSNLLDTALEFARNGFPVFPCRANKSPFMKGAFKTATCDENQIVNWWQRWPDALIGLPTGKASGLWVLDLDVDKDTGEKIGEASIAPWAEHLKDVPSVTTPSGGHHFFFKHCDGLKGTKGKLRKVDTRGEGGYVIAWGNIGIQPDDLPVIPDAFREMFKPKKVKSRKPKREAQKNGGGQFTKWVLDNRLLPAWKALAPFARDAYFHLQIRCFAETAQINANVKNNNGHIFRSPRKLAEDMGCSEKTATSGLADLQAKGWIVMTSLPALGLEGKAKTAHFRLTMMPMGSGKSFKVATQEPRRWKEGQDYPVLTYAKSKPKPRAGRSKKISPLPNRRR